jgi:hypothetical protein
MKTQKIIGMKSDDCHVIILQILPIAIRVLMEPCVRTLEDNVGPLQLFRHYLSKVDYEEALATTARIDHCRTIVS